MGVPIHYFASTRRCRSPPVQTRSLPFFRKLLLSLSSAPTTNHPSFYHPWQVPPKVGQPDFLLATAASPAPTTRTRGAEGGATASLRVRPLRAVLHHSTLDFLQRFMASLTAASDAPSAVQPAAPAPPQSSQSSPHATRTSPQNTATSKHATTPQMFANVLVQPLHIRFDIRYDEDSSAYQVGTLLRQNPTCPPLLKGSFARLGLLTLTYVLCFFTPHPVRTQTLLQAAHTAHAEGSTRAAVAPLAKLIPLYDVSLTFSKLAIGPAPSLAAVIEAMAAEWGPQLLAQLHHALRGIPPVRSLVHISSGLEHMVPPPKLRDLPCPPPRPRPLATFAPSVRCMEVRWYLRT